MTKRTHTYLMAEIVVRQLIEQEGVAANFSFAPKYHVNEFGGMTKEAALAQIAACASAATAAWLSAAMLITPEMAGSKKALSSVNAMYRTVMRQIATHIKRACEY